jgi:hypothetical protein
MVRTWKMNRAVRSQALSTTGGARNSVRVAAVEPLERRALLSATISGLMLGDVTGNGLAADDKPVAGQVVKLYKDKNGNGLLDAADGGPIASKTIGATGVFNFTGLALGKYLLADSPVNAVRTAPALSNTYAINANANTTFGGYTFANYVKSFNAKLVTGISYVITGTAGTKTVTNLAGNVHQGDTVAANFTVAAGANVTLSLVSYHAPGPVTTASNISLQEISQVQSATFGPGKHSLTVTVPDCYFQVDFVGGPAIDHFGPAGSNILYQQEGRLVSADMGGDHCCDCEVVPSSIAGRVFCDDDLSGTFTAGDTAVAGLQITLTGTTSTGEAVSATTLTGKDGTYYFGDLLPGKYTITEPEPAGHLDGKNFAAIGTAGGQRAQASAAGPDTVSGILLTSGAGQDATGYDFVEIHPGSLAGKVWVDFNNDGKIDFGEKGLPGVKIALSGTDDLGNPVTATMTTDASGAYAFNNLRPGTYTLIETQPPGYLQGKDLLGTLGGDAGVQDVFSKIFVPGCDGDGTDYHFGEQPGPGTSLLKGGTATIGFWHNKNGQALLLALNGGPTATQLGNWMAATFPNLYGSLAGKTNADIAAYYLNNLFSVTGQKLGAQVMGAVFAVYCTNASLAGNVAVGYGFTVSTYGTGIETINVGSNGAAFGVPNNSTITVLQALFAANAQSMNGSLYQGNTSLGNQANTVFDGINQGGDIG